MKKLIFPIFFALVFISMPIETKAGFDFGRLIDPLCVFACDNDKEQTIYQTNSNNVNSNINSPNSTVISGSETDTTPIYVYHDDDDNDYTRPLYVSCYSTPTSGGIGDAIHWRSSISGGTGDYHITWSGTNGLSGNGSSVTKRYNSDGTKNASIRVRSGDRTVTRNCSSVEIYDYDRYDRDYRYDYDRDYRDYDDRYNTYLSVSCSANVSFAPVGTNVVWQAYASGGSGSYRYEWVGTDYIRGSSRTLNTSYSSAGPKYASVVVTSGSRKTTAMCTNFVTVGTPVAQYVNTPIYIPPVKTVYVPKPAPVVEKAEVKVDENTMTLASLFSLKNVPWGLVAVMVILVLLGTVIYLLLNRNKI